MSTKKDNTWNDRCCCSADSCFCANPCEIDYTVAHALVTLNEIQLDWRARSFDTFMEMRTMDALSMKEHLWKQLRRYVSQVSDSKKGHMLFNKGLWSGPVIGSKKTWEHWVNITVLNSVSWLDSCRVPIRSPGQIHCVSANRKSLLSRWLPDTTGTSHWTSSWVLLRIRSKGPCDYTALCRRWVH